MSGVVGRDAELALVLDTVRQVPTTGLAGVVVSGEAGIGKSTLLAAVADRLAGQGWRVLTVRADALESRVPYAALAGALAGGGTATDSGYTEGLRQAALTALDLPAAGTAEPAGGWFGRACAAMTRLLTAVAAAGPVVLTVDDLHELDDDSLALLAVVLRRLPAAPIGLVVSVRSHLPRPNPAAAEMLARLDDLGGDIVRVELGTLSGPELAAIITPVLGAPPDDDLARAVSRLADGNPFFATEIARSLAEARLVRVTEGRARLAEVAGALPPTRGDAVLRRVAPMTPEARAVAAVASVFRRVRLDQVGLIAAVAALDEAAVATAFDELVRAHVLTGDGVGGYRFVHDVVADALYSDIGPAETRRLHHAAAERMGRDRARGIDVDLLALAWHVAESADPGDLGAVEVLTEAADRVRTSAPERAAALYQRALELLPAGAEERVRLLSRQCRALARASRPAAAVVPGREALASLPPGPERARTATAVLSSLFSAGRIAEALAVADTEAGRDKAPAGVRAQRAVLLVFAGRPDEAEAEASAATATPMSSAAEEVLVFGQLAMLTSMLNRHEETVAYADRAVRSAGTSATLELQALAVGAVTEALAALVPDATALLRRADALAGAAGGPAGGGAFRGELLVARIALDWLGGRWDAALEGLAAANRELVTRQQAMLAGATLAIELDIRTWRGELGLAARLAAEPAPPMRNMAGLHALALAGYHTARGDADMARQRLAAGVGDPATAPYACILLGRLIALDLECGRVGDAERTLRTLVEVATPRVSPWSRTTLHRSVGLVHRDPDALARAVAEADRGGLVFERAVGQTALGELVPDAVDELLAAYQTFSRLGAHGLRRRAGRRLRELGARVPRARTRAPGLLTADEERIARLVQQGMRNRDIAATLHYSPRSIEVYLSRIYAKLRIASRLELARALDALDSGR